MNPIDEDTEGGEPRGAEEEVQRVVQEVPGERQQPDQAEEGRDGGDDLSVDLTADGAVMAIVAVL